MTKQPVNLTHLYGGLCDKHRIEEALDGFSFYCRDCPLVISLRTIKESHYANNPALVAREEREWYIRALEL